jgi:hypothetical protein
MKLRKFRLLIFICGFFVSACSTQFSNPASSIKMSDLAGTWVTEYYAGASDSVTLNENGTFRQIFNDTYHNYIFDSRLRQWKLEQLVSGEVRLHLYGGRYYLNGISFAENNGRNNIKDPCQEADCTWGSEPYFFYDPFAQEFTRMVDELLLVVQVDAGGKLILHHVWLSNDRGFAIFGGEVEVFRRR